jgi:hypothetical protein
MRTPPPAASPSARRYAVSGTIVNTTRNRAAVGGPSGVVGTALSLEWRRSGVVGTALSLEWRRSGVVGTALSLEWRRSGVVGTALWVEEQLGAHDHVARGGRPAP